MKKITLRVLFCLLITSFAYAQTANNDDVLVCYVGGTTFAYPLANDSVTVGNIDYSSLDLDQSLAGIQSSVLIESVLFNSNQPAASDIGKIGNRSFLDGSFIGDHYQKFVVFNVA